MSELRRITIVALAVALLERPAAAQNHDAGRLWDSVQVRRTTYGVPHITASSLKAASYALAYVQLEDYGARVALGLLRARGEMGRWFGRDSMEGDFFAQRAYAIAVASYPKLDRETREVYDGFAAGVNRYVELHPAEFPPGFAPNFTGYDVASRDVNGPSIAAARRFVARMTPQAPRRTPAATDNPPSLDDAIEEGSNAWAFAPSRTKSGRAILMRNPHLAWNSGYYEGQVVVPGVLDFYGDFRIGGPFGVVGGFNRDLGWATTNNAPDLDEIYALDVEPNAVDHYHFDGASLPLRRELVTVVFKNGDGYSSETREFWSTSLGPVVHRDSGKVYVIRSAGDDGYQGGEQFLRMMRAHSLAEWKDALRLRARESSNFTYADRVGNIFYVWNASIPALPHANGHDTLAVPAHRMSDVWTRYVPFDSLPQLLNPRGGYVQNENDPPYHTNLKQVLDRARYPANFPDPALSLRSQHSLLLLDNARKFSLEDVVALKHSYRMILADRVKNDLLSAARRSAPDSAMTHAIDVLSRWDNTASAESRGSVLFEQWWRRYGELMRPDSLFAESWDAAAPLRGPRGLKDSVRAVDALKWAIPETVRRFGAVDVAWGDVHRVRVGSVDVPVGGCAGALGCFRVLNYRTDPDGKLAATGGDGWIIIVEFADVPRAYSVLAYGESAREESPNHSDQAAMFARGELKRVAFTERDIQASTVRSYRPGENP